MNRNADLRISVSAAHHVFGLSLLEAGDHVARHNLAGFPSWPGIHCWTVMQTLSTSVYPRGLQGDVVYLSWPKLAGNVCNSQNQIPLFNFIFLAQCQEFWANKLDFYFQYLLKNWLLTVIFWLWISASSFTSLGSISVGFLQNIKRLMRHDTRIKSIKNREQSEKKCTCNDSE